MSELPAINLKLEIRRNSDGDMAEDLWEDWRYHTFWWEEGNASCDCNRELFFLQARNEDEPDDTECGEGKYSVRLSDADTGKVLYDEITSNVKREPEWIVLQLYRRALSR